MAVDSGHTHIGDLSFQIFARSLHPEWFRVRRHLRLLADPWEADVRIIEGGHAVIFRHGETRMTEVMCTSATELPEPGLLFHAPVRHERSTTLRPGPGFEYQTCFEVERVDRELFAHLTEEVTLDADRTGLFQRFSPSNRMAPAAISHIRVESLARGLSVQAFHTFPEDLAVVRVVSLFEMRVPQPAR